MGSGQSLFTNPPQLIDVLWTKEISFHVLKSYLMGMEAKGSLPANFTKMLPQTKLSNDSMTVPKISDPVLSPMDLQLCVSKGRV